MKKILQTIAVVAISGILFNACSKPYEPVRRNPLEEQDNPLRGEFSCNLYDSADYYEADEKLVKDDFIDGNRYFSVYTKEYSDSLDPTVYRSIYFTISNFNGVGTYPIDFYTDISMVIAYDSANIHTFEQVSYEPETFINITKADNGQYEGDFRFRLKNSRDTTTIMVTNGVFTLEKS